MRITLVLLAGVGLVAPGCGGSSASAEETWAKGVCTDVSNWQKQVRQATNDVKAQLQSPKAGTLSAIQADVRKAGDATRQLATNLKSRGAPKTNGGTQAKQQLDALGSRLDATVTKAKQALAAIPNGASLGQTASALSSLAPDLQSLATSTSSTLKSVQAQGKALKEGFQKADACKQFR